MRRTNKNSYLIVDGYNIINAWDNLKEISKVDLDGAREKLVHYIIEYAQYTGKKAIIVFDAYNVKNSKEIATKVMDSIKDEITTAVECTLYTDEVKQSKSSFIFSTENPSACFFAYSIP